MLQTQQLLQRVQHCGGWCCVTSGAQQQAGLAVLATVTKRHTAHKALVLQQLACGVARGLGGIGRQPGDGHQLPGQGELAHIHCRMFQFGLMGVGAEQRRAEGVHTRHQLTVAAAPAQKFAAPVHGDEQLRWPQLGAGRHRQHHSAAA